MAAPRTFRSRCLTRATNLGRLALVGLGALALAGCQRRVRPSRPDGNAVVLLAPEDELERSLPFVDEQEPNDARAAAMVLPWNGDPPVAAVRGVVGEGSDEADLFKLTMPGTAAGDADVVPSRLELLVRGFVGGSIAELLDGQMRPIATAQGGAGERLGFPNVAVTPGQTLFLRLRANREPVRYRVTARLGRFGSGEEQEPNDHPGQATLLLPLDQSPEAAGLASGPGDQDWYRIPLGSPAADRVVTVELEPPAGVMLSLSLHLANERRLVVSRARHGERLALRNVSLAALGGGGPPDAGAGGSFLVLVRTEMGRTLDAPYILRIHADPLTDGEVEPNDDLAHASPLPEGGAKGYLLPGDVDLFRIEPAAGSELDVRLEPPRRQDLQLHLLGPTGAVLLRSDAGRRGEVERLPNVFAAGGALFIKIVGAKGEARVDEPYLLTTTVRAAEEGAEREPNDEPARASALTAGEAHEGLLSPRGDRDLWRVAPLAAATPLRLVPPAGGELEVTLLDGDNGKKIRSLPAISQETVEVLPPGSRTLVVQVKSPAGRAGDPEHRYRLELEP